jgi:hypothetical protein
MKLGSVGIDQVAKRVVVATGGRVDQVLRW